MRSALKVMLVVILLSIPNIIYDYGRIPLWFSLLAMLVVGTYYFAIAYFSVPSKVKYFHKNFEIEIDQNILITRYQANISHSIFDLTKCSFSINNYGEIIVKAKDRKWWRFQNPLLIPPEINDFNYLKSEIEKFTTGNYNSSIHVIEE
ncbi:hypothetical protein [Reichenbachiella ulvae]|uniref:PH domain-containing protein n=1 Tax=Reichenbachiella ulvae TaxID=2980104 RepID=A0ABT3CTN8_9BACT|nr:hypothetical protein [Reichenbachiella ulvae]MCV9386984.1 hypothetical protein [Reichenbachiella ulvae]